VRVPRLFFLFAAAGLVAAPAVKVNIDSAQMTLGPGIEPRPGTPAFRPRLDARFSLSNVPKGTVLHFRFWLATESGLTTLRDNRRIQSGSAEIHALEGVTKALEEIQAFQLTAYPTNIRNGSESLVIEVISKGRLRARGTAAIVERHLPASVPREVNVP